MMALEQEPFTRYDDKPERDNSTFTIRLSKEEHEWLFQCMELLDVKIRATALKALAEMGKNVLLTTFPSNLKYLFKKDRVRLSDLSAKEIKNLKNCVKKD